MYRGIARPPRHPAGIGIPACAHLAGLGVLFVILRTAASHDVRESPQYLFFYLVLGAAWAVGSSLFLPYFGLSWRDDLLERGNLAAIPALAGAVMGIFLCFAGGNIGDGPGWWVVIFSAALSTGTLFGVWLIVENLSHPSDSVTVDRDPASGIRLGGLLVALGLVLGRSVAGDWTSAAATVRDFAMGAWPAPCLAAIATFLEQTCRPRPDAPRRSVAICGLLPAAMYLAVAVGVLIARGSWDS